MINIGTLVSDRYEILDKIGTGGMSDVYKAKDHKLNRLVAVKMLKYEFSENADFVSKFRVEAQAAAGLMHPNIVNVYDVGEEKGLYYIVMELVDGITLKKYIEKKARLSVRETISIAIQVSMGLEAAHKNHIIHRDVKPQNIIISKDGKVKVTDFGIAKAATSNTITSNVMGSVHYTSPEQARGGYSDEKSDIYSLGITIFEMLTGRVPFNGETTVAIAIKHIQSQMPSPCDFVPEIPRSVEQIVLKCCEKRPDRRYQNMTDLIADLKQSLLHPDDDFVKVIRDDEDSMTIPISIRERREMRDADKSYQDGVQDGTGYQDDGFGDQYENYDLAGGTAYTEDEDDTSYSAGYDEEQFYPDESYPEEPYPAEQAYPDEQYGDEFFGQEPEQGEDFLTDEPLFTIRKKEPAAPKARKTRREKPAKPAKPAKTRREPSGRTGQDEYRSSRKPAANDGYRSRGSHSYQSGNLNLDKQRRNNYEDDFDGVSGNKWLNLVIILAAVALGIALLFFAAGKLGLMGAGSSGLLGGLTTEKPASSAEEPSSGPAPETPPASGDNSGEASPSQGAPQIAVPDVVGNRKDQAKVNLENKNFKVNFLEAYSDTVEKGTVISQDPAGGELRENGSIVNVTVSLGEDMTGLVQVPNLSFKTEEEAKDLISRSNLTLGTVNYVDTSDPNLKGKVTRQVPAEGEYVSENTEVMLEVGKLTYMLVDNLYAPSPAEDPNYVPGSPVYVIVRTDDGKELLNQIVNAFPCPVSFRGLTASSGTVEMAYAYADGQQGHLMRQLAFTPEN